MQKSAKDKFDATMDALERKYSISFTKASLTLLIIIVSAWLASMGWELISPTKIPLDVKDPDAFIRLSRLASFILLLIVMLPSYAIYLVVRIAKLRKKSNEALKTMVAELLIESNEKKVEKKSNEEI